jgi:hypothetical protein
MAMSAAAAAKRRRAGINPPPVTQPNQNQNQAERLISNLQNMQNSVQPQAQPQVPTRPLNLQQIIQLLDSRIVKLEKSAPISTPEVQSTSSSIPNEKIVELVNEAMAEHVSEFNTRSEMLANEIMQLKDIVLSLQSYTMSVNKMLLDERIQILSEIPEPETPTVTVSQTEDNIVLSDVNDMSIENTNVTPEENISFHIEQTVSEPPVDTPEIFVSESPIIQAVPLEKNEEQSDVISDLDIVASAAADIQDQIHTDEKEVSEDQVQPLSSKQTKASNRKKRSTFVLETEEPNVPM